MILSRGQKRHALVTCGCIYYSLWMIDLRTRSCVKSEGMFKKEWPLPTLGFELYSRKTNSLKINFVRTAVSPAQYTQSRPM